MATYQANGGAAETPLFINRAQNTAKAATSEVIDLTGSSPEPSDNEAAPFNSAKASYEALKQAHLRLLASTHRKNLDQECENLVPGPDKQRKPFPQTLSSGNECPGYSFEAQCPFGIVEAQTKEGRLTVPTKQVSPAPSALSPSKHATLATVTDSFESPYPFQLFEAQAKDGRSTVAAKQASPTPSASSPYTEATVATVAMTPTVKVEEVEDAEFIMVGEAINATDPTLTPRAPETDKATPAAPSSAAPKRYVYPLRIEHRINTNLGGPPQGAHDEFGTLVKVVVQDIYDNLQAANGAVKMVFEVICNRTGLGEGDALRELDRGESGVRLFIYLDHPVRFESWSIYTEEKVLR